LPCPSIDFCIRGPLPAICGPGHPKRYIHYCSSKPCGELRIDRVAVAVQLKLPIKHTRPPIGEMCALV
jgi:hypothetical protein